MKVQPILNLNSKENKRDEEVIIDKNIFEKSSEDDYIFQEQDDSFSIQYGIRLIKMVSVFNIFCSITITIIGSIVLFNGGQQWSGHLPSFVTKQTQVEIFLSNLLLLLSIMQIKQLGKIPLSFFQTILLIIFTSFIVTSSLSAAFFSEAISINSQSTPSDKYSKCQNNYSKFWHQQILSDYEQIFSKFCSDECPCEITQNNIKKFKSLNPNAVVRDRGHKNLLSCSSSISNINPYSVKTIKYLEDHWRCSNICQASQYYLFNKVEDTDSLVEESCFQLLAQKTNYLVKLIFLPGLIIGILLILGWVFQLYCIVEIKRYKNYQILIQDALKTQETSNSTQIDTISKKNSTMLIQQSSLNENVISNSKSSDQMYMNTKTNPFQWKYSEKQSYIVNEDKMTGAFTRLASPKNTNKTIILKDYQSQDNNQTKKFYEKPSKYEYDEN